MRRLRHSPLPTSNRRAPLWVPQVVATSFPLGENAAWTQSDMAPRRTRRQPPVSALQRRA